MVGNVSWITKFNIRCFQSKFFTVFQAMNHILNKSGFHLLLSKIRTKLVVPINSIIEIKKMIYLKRTLLASERVTGPLNNVRYFTLFDKFDIFIMIFGDLFISDFWGASFWDLWSCQVRQLEREGTKLIHVLKVLILGFEGQWRSQSKLSKSYSW